MSHIGRPSSRRQAVLILLPRGLFAFEAVIAEGRGYRSRRGAQFRPPAESGAAARFANARAPLATKSFAWM